jgi:predicted nucleotidyltransferase
MRQLGDIALRDDDRTAIVKATREIREATEVVAIVLFGSKARGDDGPESDIDILVVTRQRLTRSERHGIVDRLFPIQLDHDVVLSPLFVSAEEWESGPISLLPIRLEIDEHGVAA